MEHKERRSSQTVPPADPESTGPVLVHELKLFSFHHPGDMYRTRQIGCERCRMVWTADPDLAPEVLMEWKRRISRERCVSPVPVDRVDIWREP